MLTRTRRANVPPGYASTFPAFAVTVDVVILTMADGVLHVLLVRRGQEPYKGMWAIPGGFKVPRRHWTRRRDASSPRRRASTSRAC